MKEIDFMHSLLKRIKKHSHIRLFRNNVGIGIAYDFAKRKPCFPMRFIRYGLQKGSSDLIGWKSVEVTPEMLGKRLAVFTAVETKSAKGKASTEQSDFLKDVISSGGIGIVAKNMEDVNIL
jgi:hypothetical protein